MVSDLVFTRKYFFILACCAVFCFYSGSALAQAITPLSYSPERSQVAHKRWHFGEIQAVSNSRLIFNSGHVDLALMDANTGAYLKALDTVALYKYVEDYVDTSTNVIFQPYKDIPLEGDTVEFSRYPLFNSICPIPGSTDLLVQAYVQHRPKEQFRYPWSEVHMMLRVDTALNVVSIHDLVQDWRPAAGEIADSVIARSLAAVVSEKQLIFFERDKTREDSILRLYELEDGKYVPAGKSELLFNKDWGTPEQLTKQIKYSVYEDDSDDRELFFISSPSGKTQSIDTIEAENLLGHQYFDVEPVRGTDNVVLLTGEPNDVGYVASKTLSLYNVSTKKYTLLGTYAKATTKAYDVCVLDGVVYVLLYDDRRNRQLLQRVSLEEEKPFRM